MAYNRGEPDAFSDVFLLFNREIRYFIRKLINDDDLSNDLTQESFIKLFNQQNQFAGLENIRAYLGVIARNICFDHFRKLKKEKKIFLKNRGIEFELNGFELSIFDTNQNEMIEATVLKIVCESVDELPGQCQLVYKKLYFEEKDVATVADEMSLTQDTIRSQRRRGLKLLIEKLKEKTSGKGLFMVFVLVYLYGMQSNQATL
jgi:RNA polymerase sigma-70 factor (ECF subfamily)